MLQYFQLFFLFFKIGLFSFGGGYAMLPLIYKEIKILNLVSVKDFSDIIALSQMTPGPIAVNTATYVGYTSAGITGSIFTTIGVSLPSFIIIFIISNFFYKFKSSSIVQSILNGIRPATVGMIVSAVILLAKTSIFNGNISIWNAFKHPCEFVSMPALLIFILTIMGAKLFKMGPITLTILAGIVGVFIL